MPKVSVQQICDTFPGKACTVNTRGAPSTPWLLTVTEIREGLASGAFLDAQSLLDPSGEDTGRVRVTVAGKPGAPFKAGGFHFGEPQLSKEQAPPTFPPADETLKGL